jgi:hypothetical protein
LFAGNALASGALVGRVQLVFEPERALAVWQVDWLGKTPVELHAIDGALVAAIPFSDGLLRKKVLGGLVTVLG